MWGRYFSHLSYIFLGALSLLGMSGQVFAQATANPDTYFAGDLTQFPDIECGVGYILSPDPTANDVVSSQANIDQPEYFNTINPPVSGTGIIFPRDIEGDGFFETIFFPACSSTNDGSFSAPVTFNYLLHDTFDNSRDSSTITINPGTATVIRANDDTYNADDLPSTPGPGTGETTYTLTPSPFVNDTITGPVNIIATLAPGNFIQVAGTGTFSAFIDANDNQVFEYTNTTFDTPAIVNYFLRDSSGNAIPNTDATITINPPASTSIAPIAVDDVFNVDALTQIADPNGECGTGYIFDPFANDTFTTLNYDAILSAGFPRSAGQGLIEFDPNSLQLIYFPACPGDGSFSTPAVFTYTLEDTASTETDTAQITFNPPGTIDAQDDVVAADDLVTVTDPVTNNIGYRIDPFANDIFAGQDPVNLDLVQTLNPDNFVRVQGSGSIAANNDNGIEVIYYPEGAFTDVAVFNYTLYDTGGQTDSASITISPPGSVVGAPPFDPQNDINDACAIEVAEGRRPAICDDTLISASERLLILSTISAQADAMFGMQGDLIANIRQRMSENRSVYNPASVAGLNSNLYGKSVPIGKIAQELLKPLTGGGAAGDFANSGRLGFFLNGNFSAGDRDETGLTGGYDQDGYNFTSGIDYRVNLNLIIGAALGIAKEDTEFAANRGEQSADITSFSFYGNYFPSNALYADWLLMLTQGDLSVKRNVGVLSEVAKGDTAGDLWSFAGTLGYHWNQGAWELDGYGRVEYTSLEIDSYTETGSSFDLTVFDQDAQSTEAALGLKVARVVSLKSGVIIPSLDLEWLSQFEDDTRFIGVQMEQISTAFAVEDEGADSTYFNAAFSLSSVFAGGFSAYLRVESMLGDDHISRTTYGGGLRWEF